MIHLADKKLIQLVLENISITKMLYDNGINLREYADLTVQEVCVAKNMALSDFKLQLQNNNYPSYQLHMFYQQAPEQLVKHIVGVHHRYIIEQVQVIIEYFDKLISNKATCIYDLEFLQRLFFELTNEFLTHLDEEEEALFPFILRYINAVEHNEKVSETEKHKLLNLLYKAEDGHKSIHHKMEEIAGLTNQYQACRSTCTTSLALLNLLKEFHEDLDIHFTLESSILYPKVLLLSLGYKSDI